MIYLSVNPSMYIVIKNNRKIKFALNTHTHSLRFYALGLNKFDSLVLNLS